MIPSNSLHQSKFKLYPRKERWWNLRGILNFIALKGLRGELVGRARSRQKPRKYGFQSGEMTVGRLKLLSVGKIAKLFGGWFTLLNPRWVREVRSIGL
eukprot:1394762-Amorphochlora_amoeboformis.AAC.1